MFDWFKKLFASKSIANDPLWRVMEEMDPLLSCERFQALELTERQRPLMKGLIDGTLKPAEFDAVGEWIEQHGENEDGIDALVFALQHVLEGTKVTYLYEYRMPVPTARFPNLVNKSALTVLFNDRECHLQITSLKEFVSSNNIHKYTLEALEIDQFIGRFADRANQTQGASESSTTNQSSVATGRKQSITIERKANAAEQLDETVGAAEIASALNQAGFNVTSDEVHLESPIDKLGMYKVPVQLDPDTESKVYVWVVPLVEPQGSES